MFRLSLCEITNCNYHAGTQSYLKPHLEAASRAIYKSLARREQRVSAEKIVFLRCNA
jgi:hypothetical protein